MTTSPDAAPEPTPTLRQRVLKKIFMRSPIEWLSAGFLIVLVVSGLFGGLGSVAAPETPTITPGVGIAADPFTITVDRVFSTEELPAVPLPADAPEGTAPRPPQKADGRFIVVRGTLLNTSDKTVEADILKETVLLTGTTGGFTTSRYYGRTVPAEQATPRLVTVPDLAPLTATAPGITYQVAWVFEQSSEVAAPAALEVVVNAHVWRQDSLDFSYKWLDADVRAEQSFPLSPGELS